MGTIERLINEWEEIHIRISLLFLSSCQIKDKEIITSLSSFLQTQQFQLLSDIDDPTHPKCLPSSSSVWPRNPGKANNNNNRGSEGCNINQRRIYNLIKVIPMLPTKKCLWSRRRHGTEAYVVLGGLLHRESKLFHGGHLRQSKEMASVKQYLPRHKVWLVGIRNNKNKLYAAVK